MSRTFWAVWGLMMWWLVTLLACTQTPPPTIRIGLPLWTGYAPLYVAEAEGLVDSRFQVVDYNSPAKMVRAYQLGSLDAVAMTSQYAVELSALDGDHRAAMLLDESSGGDALLVRPDITSLAELKGRTIAVEVSSLGVYMLHRALEEGGLSSGDVTLRSLDIDAQLAAWRAGEVDAVITYEPIRSAILAEGAVVRFDSGDIPGEIVDLMIMRQSTIDAHLDAMVDLQGFWYTGREMILEQPARALPHVAARLKAPAEQLPEQIAMLRWPDEAEARSVLTGADARILRGLARSAEQQGLDGFSAGSVFSDTLIMKR